MSCYHCLLKVHRLLSVRQDNQQLNSYVSNAVDVNQLTLFTREFVYIPLMKCRHLSETYTAVSPSADQVTSFFGVNL